MVVKRANASETFKSLSISQSSQTRSRSRRIFQVCCQSAVVLQITPCSHWSRFWKLDRSEIDLARNFSFCLIWILETGQLTGLLIFRAVAEARNSGKSAKSREIHKNTKIPQNSEEILSNTRLYNIFETYFSYRGYLLAVNLQIYLWASPLKRANNVPKLPGVELGTNHDVKGFAIGSFLERIVVERVNDDLC